MNKKIVYVYTAPYFKTGGTELCHQLVYQINNMGGEAYIAYEYAEDGKYLNPAFEKYVNEYVVVDDEFCKRDDIIIVIPESFTLDINRFKNAEIYLWWMSVDNYFRWQNLRIVYQEIGLLRTVKYVLFKYSLKKKYLPIKKMGQVKKHLVQSEYAMDYLKKKGVKNIYYLSDYINEDYIIKSDEMRKGEKEDYVVYNPSKGKRFTNMIIKHNSDIRFVALQNMSNEEVANCLSKAKVYIDFGSHPGKDRFPREAALMGCCIITGRRGSANYDDVFIPNEFKIKDKKINMRKIKNAINNALNNYDVEIKKYEQYISKIKEEKNVFVEDVRKVFFE